ncbi:hypothetical protein HWV03_04715 [Moritella sp. 36]|uniref:hypothetical protein n=1 Tax=Moritella sp. 36 TaxID=2746233 RepID=UPI001BACB1A4|nr:hypothetical protein [Moritella sp. 36]QUM88175.1 hypothetical protein HWV03_04715 [Moritella sp. 36]
MDSAATKWATNWNAESHDGIKNNGVTTFSYSRSVKRQALIQGYMKTASSTGRSGIAPVISIRDGNRSGN